MRKDFIKQNYNRILKYTFILTLFIFILVFYFSDKTSVFEANLPVVKFTAFTIVEIPRTKQKIKKRPRPLRPSIPVASDEIDIIDEVELEESAVSVSDIGLGGDTAGETFSEARQILETVPKDTENRIKGYITLNLQIDKYGKVKACRIKETSLSDSAYASVIKSAVMKSLWKPALKNGKPIESWVIKTYSFDN
jgi:hypothetical protein